MSKVYIRSQDRDVLVLFGDGFNSIYYQLRPEIQLAQNACIQKQHAVVVKGGDARYCIGVYESKERCLEILDDIHKACGTYYQSTGVLGMPDMLFEKPVVYQMPEK